MIKGFSRLWLVLTVLWVALVALVTWLVWISNNPLVPDLIVLGAVGPPLIVLAIGAFLRWSFRGFRL
jgi:hypothetical protein